MSAIINGGSGGGSSGIPSTGGLFGGGYSLVPISWGPTNIHRYNIRFMTPSGENDSVTTNGRSGWVFVPLCSDVEVNIIRVDGICTCKVIIRCIAGSELMITDADSDVTFSQKVISGTTGAAIRICGELIVNTVIDNSYSSLAKPTTAEVSARATNPTVTVIGSVKIKDPTLRSVSSGTWGFTAPATVEVEEMSASIGNGYTVKSWDDIHGNSLGAGGYIYLQVWDSSGNVTYDNKIYRSWSF